MKTKNTNPKPRTKPPLFVFKFKIGQFTWIAACRRCSFAKGYYSHPLALKAALSHHSKCLNTQSAPDLYGWIELQSLWSEGEVPLRRKTADQLKVGHLFTGRKLNGSPREYLLCTSGGEEDVLVLWARDFIWTTLQARDWEVITDHGLLQKPEVN